MDGQGRGRGRGGGGGGQHFRQRATRVGHDDVPKTNRLYEKYYTELGLVEEAEYEEFWNTLRRELPNSFRFTGSRA